MVADLIRDSTFGQIVNWASGGRYFPYRDQLPDYVDRFAAASERPPSPTDTLRDEKKAPLPELSPQQTLTTAERGEKGEKLDEDVKDAKAFDPYLVDWDGEDDPDNPRWVIPSLRVA